MIENENNTQFIQVVYSIIDTKLFLGFRGLLHINQKLVSK